MESAACLDEGAAAAFAEARMPPASIEGVAAHLRACADCQERVAAAMTSSRATRTAVTEILGPTPMGESGTEPGGGPRRPLPPRAPALEPGVSIGRYTVLALVGRGGMGEVYAAYDPSLDRKVALKLMLSEVSAEDDFAQERLLREAQAIAKLSHPNVVVVHDVGTFSGRVFIAMEFVEGTTLAGWLAEKERPWREIVAAFVQAARGLGAAHRGDIVHRDFKPQNVMVTKDGSVRVMDFGMARYVGDRAGPSHVASPGSLGSPALSPVDLTITRTGQQVGTPLYMAPEQFAGGDVDARADQFSFCVGLFWALNGAHPFGAGSPSSVAEGATKAAPPRSAAAAPAWLQRVLVRGLRAEPSERWPSMDELAVALTREPLRRRRSTLAVAAAVVACVAAGVGAARIVDSRRALCTDGSARLTGVWEAGEAGQRPGSRRQAVRAAILAQGQPEDAQIWNRVSMLLDRHAAEWLSAYREACASTNVRHEQSAEALDLRMACLNDNLDSTRAVAELLSSGDPRPLEHATEAAGSLQDLARCSDVAQLRAGIRPPKDPRIGARVEELRKKLREGNARNDAGDLEGARQIAKATLMAAAPLHYPPVEAEAEVLEGDAALALGPVAAAAAAAALEKAVVVAQSCGHDRVVAEAAIGLVAFYGRPDEADWRSAERYAALARATLERMGGDARLEGWLANNLGLALLNQGLVAEAKTELEHAIDVKSAHLGRDHLDVAISQLNLADVLSLLGRPADAAKLAERATATVRRWVRSATPLFVDSIDIYGKTLVKVGRLDEAEAQFQEARRLVEASSAPARSAEDVVLGGLGEVRAARARPREALPYFERALRLGTSASLVETAEFEFETAKVREAIRPGDPKSLDLARKADAVYAARPGLVLERREVEAWLEARQSARRDARSSAARKLSGRATPVPAMSNAVP